MKQIEEINISVFQKKNKEVQEKGFLPMNENYNEVPQCPQEQVENDPTRFIIEECIPACKELWSKNIYTFMVSDHVNEGECWIEVVEDCLSDENREIFFNLSGDGVRKYRYHSGCLTFCVDFVGKEGQQKLLELAKEFKMQDVPKNVAYIKPYDFLIKYCGCFDEYPNPEYKYMTPPEKMDLDVRSFLDYMDDYDKWLGSVASKKTLKRLATYKIIKPISEYATDHGMIYESERVYLSEFHYSKHRKYIEYLNQQEFESGNESSSRH